MLFSGLCDEWYSILIISGLNVWRKSKRLGIVTKFNPSPLEESKLTGCSWQSQEGKEAAQQAQLVWERFSTELPDFFPLSTLYPFKKQKLNVYKPVVVRISS